ncbi:hypothetical protein BD413DRAFT_494624 [Trametes elegans]|nr:hypothetical protein BD413DRAFT_494624 [Trametes elegans]
MSSSATLEDHIARVPPAIAARIMREMGLGHGNVHLLNHEEQFSNEPVRLCPSQQQLLERFRTVSNTHDAPSVAPGPDAAPPRVRPGPVPPGVAGTAAQVRQEHPRSLQGASRSDPASATSHAPPPTMATMTPAFGALAVDPGRRGALNGHGVSGPEGDDSDDSVDRERAVATDRAHANHSTVPSPRFSRPSPGPPPPQPAPNGMVPPPLSESMSNGANLDGRIEPATLATYSNVDFERDFVAWFDPE